MARGLTLLGGIVFGALFLAAPANAAIEKKGGYSYVNSTSVKIKPGKQATVKATCPGKTHVLAGSSLPEAPFNDVTTSVGIPFDGSDKDKTPDDGWLGQASSYADVNIKLRSKAVCSALKPKYVIEKRTAGPLAQSLVNAVCNRGKAIAGGMLGDVGTNSGYPSGGTWGLFADNYRSNEREVKTAAVCLRADFEITSIPGSVSGFTPTQGFASCGSNDVGINIGQSNNGSFFRFNTVSTSAFPTGASFRYENYHSGTTTFTNYLICREKLR